MPKPSIDTLKDQTEREVRELMAEVRRIEVAAGRQVNDMMAGEYVSAFRGRGMEFDEVREYSPGDDIRAIDWNVTARTGRPYVKRYVEERELTLLFLVDLSASGVFGSGDRTKIRRAIEISATLMFNALRNNDKVGLVTFASGILNAIPARKSKGHVLRLVRDLIAARPARGQTRFADALDYIARVQRRKCALFIVSDFIGFDDVRALSRLAARHDVVALTIRDPREAELPDAGVLVLEDAETGKQIEIDSSSARVRDTYLRLAQERAKALTDIFRRAGVDELVVDTTRPFSQTLHEFFKRRERRMAR
ncbi:MAG: DUF58 domain-containing protein [Planctomycetota bacterium]